MRIEAVPALLLALPFAVHAQSGEDYRLQLDAQDYRLRPRAEWHLPPAEQDNPSAERRPFAEAISEAAEAAGIEAELLHAVVKTESAYRADAVSAKGAHGLAQLMPDTAARFAPRGGGVDANLLAGARFLRSLIERFEGELQLALAAYNAGPGAVERHGGIPPYPETRAYVPRVMAEYEALRAERRTRPTPWQLRGEWQARPGT